MKKNKQSKRKIIFLILAPLLLVLVAAASPFLINEYVKRSIGTYVISPEEAQSLRADCILVLGAGIRRDGTPNHMLEDRLLRGIELYRLGAADTLLMSGDHGARDYDEVNAMKQYAMGTGIPSEDIFMDHAGFSTYDSMYRAKEIFGVKKAIVVTQEYHLYRALYLAKAMGLEVYGVSASLRSYAGQPYFDKRELLARVKDFFSVIFMPKPAFLGDAIPISGSGDATNDCA